MSEKKSVDQMIREWFEADLKPELQAMILTPPGQALTAGMIGKIRNDLQWLRRVARGVGRN